MKRYQKLVPVGFNRGFSSLKVDPKSIVVPVNIDAVRELIL